MRMKRLTVAALGAVLLAVGACAPIKDRRGFIPDETQSTDIAVATDTKSSVLTRLGNPSTIGVFDEQTWYYVSAERSQLAFYRARTPSRTVIAVTFDDADRVAEVSRFGIEDGRIVNYNRNETPTRGRELTILEQLFGNIGRAPVRLPGEEPNLPGGAGGPRTGR
jgi:outer membrane protein assembly factor BamE (lipoprotein component of BamABCDE complex)